MPTSKQGTAKYNMPLRQPYGADVSAVSQAAVSTASSIGKTDNPFLWLVGIAGVTLGLIGFSASAHVGKLRASLSV